MNREIKAGNAIALGNKGNRDSFVCLFMWKNSLLFCKIVERFQFVVLCFFAAFLFAMRKCFKFCKDLLQFLWHIF